MLFVQKPESLPPLHQAAYHGDAEQIRLLLVCGADKEDRSNTAVDYGSFCEGLTPLMVAAGSEHGSEGAVKELLGAGSDPFARSAGGVTALWYAAGSGDAARIGALLAFGGDPNETADSGRRCIGEAVEAGAIDSVRVLLAAGASPDPVGATPAYEARAAAHMKEKLGRDLEQWLGDRPIEASTFSSYQIPLFRAASGGNAECVSLLIEAGASPHLRDDSARTALMDAASPEVVRALVTAGSDIHARDRFDRSSLDRALQNGYPEVLRALAEAGADLEAKDNYGSTALLHFCGALEVDAKMVQALLEAGADLQARTYDGRTALHQAVELLSGDRHGQLGEVIRVLVGAGLPIDIRDDHGRTPLHLAVGEEGGEKSAIHALLALGADVNAVGAGGDTPLIFAATYCHYASEVVPILLTAGADPRLANHDGLTALDYARNGWEMWVQIVATPTQETLAFVTPAFRDRMHQEALHRANEVVKVLEAATAP